MKTTTRPLAPRRMARRMVPRKVLHARAAASEEDFDEIDGESEPNMKLSHAFIVVLVLHVLAVGGVFAFNTLKTKQIIPDRAAKSAAAKTETAQAAPAEKPAPVEAATYTVVAGDTLKKIASRHKTSIEAIEKANDITSTTTIRVGQVLRLPASAAAKPSASQAKLAPPPAPAAKVASAGVVAPLPAAKAPAASHAPVKQAASKEPAAVPTTKTSEPKAAKAAEAKPAQSADAKPAAPAAAADGEKSYVVAAGDNPYTIAKKLKISYSDLLKANKIDDPKKLQIGQKLIVP